jgi:endo-1,4-beta-xylanase
MAGWDVVNEPVAEDGDGLRDCHWSRALGMDGYMVRAFEQARAADPEAILFLNEYNLENIPRKGATFLKLVERLLKLGAPIGGIGTQSHLDIEIPAGQITRFMRDAASLGLPIHVSELDFPMQRDGGRMPDLRSTAERRAQQVARERAGAASGAGRGGRGHGRGSLVRAAHGPDRRHQQCRTGDDDAVDRPGGDPPQGLNV